jgi:hypothetical protein
MGTLVTLKPKSYPDLEGDYPGTLVTQKGNSHRLRNVMRTLATINGDPGDARLRAKTAEIRVIPRTLVTLLIRSIINT